MARLLTVHHRHIVHKVFRTSKLIFVSVAMIMHFSYASGFSEEFYSNQSMITQYV
jgi:hypothetical protein